MKYSIYNWPYKWFGRWCESINASSIYPSVQDFVDKEINATYRKQELLSYLKNGHGLRVTGQWSVNPFTHKSTGRPVYIQTDGVWIWEEIVCELIKFHDLVIPVAFYEHIKSNNFKVPKLSEEEMMALMPPSFKL